jgi:hypothetical protein
MLPETMIVTEVPRRHQPPAGNAPTRYNWHASASNRASDWYFERIADGSALKGILPTHLFPGQAQRAQRRSRRFRPPDGSRRWAPIASKLASFSVAKYGSKTGADSRGIPMPATACLPRRV